MRKRLSVKLWLVIGAVVLAMLLVVGLGFWFAQTPLPSEPEGQSPLGEAIEMTQLDGLVTVNIPGGIVVQESGGKETLVFVDAATSFIRHKEPDSAKIFELEDVKVGERVSTMVVPDGKDVRALSIILMP